jgi:hypothetical protein
MKAHVRLIGLVGAAAFGVIAAAHAAAQDPRDTICEAIAGTIVPVCNAAICNQGNVTGDLHGRFNTRTTSIYPAGSGWLYAAWLRIELDGGKGVVDLLNEGVAPRDAQGGPDLAKGTEVLTVSEATTGVYQEYTGTIVISGAYAAGRTTPYTGRLCHKTAAR